MLLPHGRSTARNLSVLTSNGTAVGHRFQPGNQHALGVEHHNPRKKQATQTLVSILNEICSGKGALGYEGKSRLYRVMDRLVKNAEEGETHAIVEILNRVDGRQTGTLLPGILGDDDDGDVEYAVTIGRRYLDGTEETATITARPADSLQEAERGDIQPTRPERKSG